MEATANTERMQETVTTVRSKDDQLAARDVQLTEIMAKLDSKDEQMKELIPQITTMNYNGGGRR